MIVVVGEPQHPLPGEVTVVPPVYVGVDRYGKQEGIRRAMSAAVRAAKPGDLVMQNDIRLHGDPFQGAPTPGKIRTLAAGRHHCPQAFIFYDEPTRQAILEAWADTRHQACVAWNHLQFVTDLTLATHERVQ